MLNLVYPTAFLIGDSLVQQPLCASYLLSKAGAAIQKANVKHWSHIPSTAVPLAVKQTAIRTGLYSLRCSDHKGMLRRADASGLAKRELCAEYVGYWPQLSAGKLAISRICHAISLIILLLMHFAASFCQGILFLGLQLTCNDLSLEVALRFLRKEVTIC